MSERRNIKRIHYWARQGVAEQSVLKSWLSIARKYKLNGFDFTVLIPDKENQNGRICKEGHKDW